MAKNMTKSHASKAVQAARAENRAQIISEIKAMARRANDRLASIEKHDLRAASNAYRYVERRHFDKDSALMSDRSGNIRFDTKLSKKSMQQLQHEKRFLERYLYESKTSTARGTMARYTRAFNTYTKNNPEVKISKKEFQKIARTAGFSNFVKQFGSDNIATLMVTAARYGKKFDYEKALGEFSKKTSIQEFYEKAGVPQAWLDNVAPVAATTPLMSPEELDTEGFIPV